MNRSSVAVLVLLLGLTALTSLPAQVLPTPLKVEVVLDAGMDAMFVDGVPRPQDVRVTVTNEGPRASTAYEVSYEWQDPAGERTPLRGTAQQSSDAGDAMFPGDDPQVHDLRWTPSDEQVGRGFVVVTVREGGSTIRPPPVEVFVEDHRFTARIEDTLPRTVGPDQTLHIPVTLQNLGNVAETLEWEVTRSHSRLAVSFLQDPQTLPVDPPTATATMVVAYPFQGSTVDVRDIVVEARATTPEGVTRFVASPEIDILHDDLPPPSSLSLTGPAGTVFAEPGGTVEVPFTLTNNGQQPDTYTLTRTTTEGWSAGPVTAGGQTVQSLSLAPGASRDLTVAVTAGTQRLGGLTVTAASQSDATATATVDLALGGALPVVTDLALTQDPLYVDDPAVVRVGYENAGDAAMEDATLTVRVQFAGGAVATKTVALDDLLPGLRRSLTLELGAAREAGPVALTATLTAGEEEAVASNPGFVHAGALSVTAPKPLAGAPGERVRYHTAPDHAFRVRNAGNAAEDVTVTVQGAEVVGESSFSLEAGQSRTVAVTQDVPADVGDAATVPVTLTASIDAAPARGDSATVHTPVQDVAEPAPTWLEAPTTMLPSGARPLRVQVEDDTYVVRAWVDVRSLDADGAETDAWRVELSEADEWIGLLRSGLPATLELTPRAEDAFGNVGTGEVRTVTVSHAPPPPPTPVTLDEVSYADGTLTVRTTAGTVRLLVDGVEAVHDVTGGELELDLPLGPGRHLIEAVVDDAAGELRRNTTVEVPTPPEEPGLLGRLTPGPGAGAALVAVAAALLARRRDRSGP